MAHDFGNERLCRYDLAIRHRGYLICPIEFEGEFECGIFDPTGQELDLSVATALSHEVLQNPAKKAIDKYLLEIAIEPSSNLGSLYTYAASL